MPPALPGYMRPVLLPFLLGCPPEPPATRTPCGTLLSIPGDPGVAVTLETGAVGLVRTYPVEIPSAVDVTWSTSGSVEVIDASGTLVTTVEGPAEVYLRAPSLGEGVALATWGQGCRARLDTVAAAPAPLVGRPRTLSPYWHSATSFLEGETIYLGLDEARFEDRVGLVFDAWLVAHRSLSEWEADPILVGSRVQSSIPRGELVPVPLAVADAGEDALAAIDVVLDFDRDGLLGPGDLIQGLGEPGAAVIGDLTAPGPHAVDTIDVSGGWFLGQRAWWPTDLAALGPRPLVVISHGNGHEYVWYDYLGEHLASWGFVVMSHQNNTEPGIEAASTTTLSNTDWMLGHLDEIGGGALLGLVDSSRIGWIGHSRGGEGVVRAFDRLADGDDVPENYGADDIAFVASIAPTVFYQVDQSDPHDRPFFLIAGTADGDVTGGVDYDIIQFFRIWERATGPKAAAYVHGASHNDFNCCAIQEGQGPALIGRVEAQVVAKAYLLAVARAWLDGEDALLDHFRDEFTGFTPLGLAEDDLVATSWRNATTAGDGVLDDFQAEYGITISSAGAAIESDVDGLMEGRLRDGDRVLGWSDDDPFNGMTHNASPSDDARGAVFSWAEGSAPSWAVAIPAPLADATGWSVVSFAVSQRSRHPRTVSWGWALAFGVTLVDVDGVEATVDFGDQALVPTPYPRLGLGPGRGWANEFVTVRVPLADFRGIDLQKLAWLRLDLGDARGAPEGALALDSVEFAR